MSCRACRRSATRKTQCQVCGAKLCQVCTPGVPAGSIIYGCRCCGTNLMGGSQISVGGRGSGVVSIGGPPQVVQMARPVNVAQPVVVASRPAVAMAMAPPAAVQMGRPTAVGVRPPGFAHGQGVLPHIRAAPPPAMAPMPIQMASVPPATMALYPRLDQPVPASSFGAPLLATAPNGANNYGSVTTMVPPIRQQYDESPRRSAAESQYHAPPPSHMLKGPAKPGAAMPPPSDEYGQLSLSVGVDDEGVTGANSGRAVLGGHQMEASKISPNYGAIPEMTTENFANMNGLYDTVDEDEIVLEEAVIAT